MAKFIPPDRINGIFREFWDKTYDEIYTSMAGMADIWEGPGNYQNSYAGAGTIIGMQYYNDKLFIVQGGGLQTFIKVISPNGVEIHMLNSQACLITHTSRDVYGSICVINDNELIIGYLYVNLELQFSAPYGLDLAELWDNPSVKITSARVSSTSWVTAIRSIGSTQFFLYSKASPEDCLPCEVKKSSVGSGLVKFSCVEERYSMAAQTIQSFRASRSMMATGASMSVTSMGGLGFFDKKPMPRANTAECILAMDEYVSLFNKARISPADIGEVGQKMSRSCSRVMYGNMLQTIQYKKEAELMHDDFIEAYIAGKEDNSDVYDKSVEIVSLIAPLLGELINSMSDNEMMRSIFSDQIWWAPLWFVDNKDKFIGVEGRINPYNLLHTVKFEDFMEVLINAASSMPPLSPSQPLPMGWIIMSDANSTPVKYSKTSMTYFRFPFATCMSSTKLFTLGDYDIDSICDIETRGDGVIIWAWKDTSTLKNRMYMKLKCYKVSNDGVFAEIGTVDIGYALSPVDNSAKAVGISSDNTYWIVRDYFLKDSVSGGIDYVETKVNISSDMTTVMNAGNSIGYANVNEITGIEALAKGTVHYSDGMLETDYAPIDLDDNFIGISSWGNDGKQYSWVKGYSGYMIHSADLL